MSATEPDLRVEHDRIHALLGQGWSGNIIAIGVAALLVAAIWDTVPRPILLGWLPIYAANLLVRFAVIRRFRQENPEGERLRVWARRYAIGLAVGGLLFGTMVSIAFPHAGPAGQMFLVVALIGMAAGGITGTAYHPPAMYAYVFPLLVPMLFRLALEGAFEYGLLAVALTLFLAGILMFGRTQATLIRRSLAVGHENVALLEELRRKTEIAEEAQRKAEQASLAKSQFFAAASHDLRQPMQALGLFAASLREAKREPEDARRIDQILSSVDTLESLFDELLDISKLDAGYVKPAPSHFALATLFARLESAYAPLARRSGLALSFEHGGAALFTDAVLLERVLGNFIANALRYTPAGNVRVSCRDAGGERVRVEVADTGIGIPAEEHERVFDEFYQLGNPERDRRKGLGLGLATVKRMTQLLGCRVTLESAPGKGSVFGVEVPKGDLARIAPPAGEVSAEDVNTLHGKLIAVVDDERDVREGLAELLGQWRCRPVAAGSTADLLRLLGDERPDAVIADYRLREHQTGVGAASALRERYGASLPVLIMSGDTTPEIFTAVREHRLPLLSKPVRAARLRAALLHVLSREPLAA